MLIGAFSQKTSSQRAAQVARERARAQAEADRAARIAAQKAAQEAKRAAKQAALDAENARKIALINAKSDAAVKLANAKKETSAEAATTTASAADAAYQAYLQQKAGYPYGNPYQDQQGYVPMGSPMGSPGFDPYGAANYSGQITQPLDAGDWFDFGGERLESDGNAPRTKSGNKIISDSDVLTDIKKRVIPSTLARGDLLTSPDSGERGFFADTDPFQDYQDEFEPETLSGVAQDYANFVQQNPGNVASMQVATLGALAILYWLCAGNR